MRHLRSNIPAVLIVIALSILPFWGCKANFEQFGELCIKHLANGHKEITDGIGRKLLLIPRGCKTPDGYRKENLVRIPVKRVVVCSPYNAALIKELGHLNSIVGVTRTMEKWHIPEIREGIKEGKITYLGDPRSIDYERLRRLRPDVVFTWDAGIVPKLDELSIPCVVTSTRIAKDLRTHIAFIRFLAAFYNEEQKGKAFAESQIEMINRISARLKGARERPGVIWGDIYAGKVQVEPGNSWAGQMVEKAGGDYLFKDLEGASCMQVTIEKFFLRAKHADILITYRGPETGITSKEKLRESSRLLQVVDIRPMNGGRIYSTGYNLYQSADTAGIIAELAAILHPGLFPKRGKTRYFFELPE